MVDSPFLRIVAENAAEGKGAGEEIQLPFPTSVFTGLGSCLVPVNALGID
jgi:hypothetical protein